MAPTHSRPWRPKCTHSPTCILTQSCLTSPASKSLLQNLILVTNTARRLPTYLPIEIIQYVEASRNPDIYTREFVELVMRYNQQQKGRSEAFATFRDILGREMASGIPDIKEDVKRVVEATGGKVES